MHQYTTDPETGLFIVSFDGTTTITDLSRGVFLCIEASPVRIAAVWDLTSMLVAFDLGEISQLMTNIAQLDFPQGRIAFITGRSAFSTALVDTSGNMRPNKRLDWRHFAEHQDALRWASTEG